jgi:hypothetical protein
MTDILKEICPQGARHRRSVTEAQREVYAEVNRLVNWELNHQETVEDTVKTILTEYNMTGHRQVAVCAQVLDKSVFLAVFAFFPC